MLFRSPGRYRSFMVLLDVPSEPVEQAKNGFCDIDGDDGTYFGGTCQSGIDESFFRNALNGSLRF